MNREIKFRGKRSDNGAWETGSLVVTGQGMSFCKYYIADKMTGYHMPVIKNTIGQFTGLFDKNGIDIYEGDVLEFITEKKYGFMHDGEKARFCIEFGKFNPRNDTLYDFIGFHTKSGSIEYRLQFGCKIIGNIHDQSELNATPEANRGINNNEGHEKIRLYNRHRS